MEIVKPWIEVENFDGINVMKRIERACRTCYRTEGSITEDSYKKLITNCISRGHESVLEHEKITIRMYCDIGVYKDLTRHRAGASYSIESTRYCNYGKDKFTNNIRFIDPVHITDEENYKIWKKAMEDLEKAYLEMSNRGAKPDELRMILPHSTGAEVTMTCNIREWRHVFELRCSKHTHPAVRQVLIPFLLLLKKEMPELFADVPYDEDFPKEKYAELRMEKE